ncbi:hypothetical protein D918_08567 [Trichuris suis]|nr:hypothetical protein D918_08567 [Trichuris suis]
MKTYLLCGGPQQPSLDSLAASITEFAYDPDNGITFEAWFKRFEAVFTVDCATLGDKAKSYSGYKFPCSTCLKLQKRESDDFVTYAGIVNRACEDFQFGTLTTDQSKCPIFICGLRAPHDAELRLQLPNKMESDTGISIKKLTEECIWFIRLRQDFKLVESNAAPAEYAFSVSALSSEKSRRTGQQKPHSQVATAPRTSAEQLRTPCWLCGSMHFVRVCPYKKHTCAQCGKSGHRESYYSSSAEH